MDTETARVASADRAAAREDEAGGLRVCELRAVLLVAVQLVMALAVIRLFQLESRTFFNVMALGSAGFVVHSLLPLRYRLPFFSFLSLAAIVLALGPWDGAYLIILGLVLIGICHLPAPTAARVVLLVAVGGLFALWRMELLPAPWSVAIWPLLASMFMFRLALYLYALKHDSHRPTVSQTLAYFFMLPNVCFPLFPVVDYSTFVRSYFDRDASRIYFSGVKWIARGLLHLILYRFVYLHLAGDPAELLTLGDLVQFLLATFLLYLRVSGQFHLIVGMLHLFGFRLPDTHHLYYLASSFTDFWRRINIYWKDFMMKLVYYPSYFKLRRRGNTFGLVAATLTVFAATWLLHSYQWFWLRGGFPLEPQDGLFWGILAIFVVVGSLREMNQPRKKKPGGGIAWSSSLAFRTLATFVTICILWSLWSAESVVEWLMIWPVAGNVETTDLWLLFGLTAGFLLIAGYPWSGWETYDASPQPFYRRSEFRSSAMLIGILLVGNTALYRHASPQVAALVISLQGSTLNARDAGLQHKGYYENLDNASRQSLQLWNLEARKPAHWGGFSKTDAYRTRDGFLVGELVPNAHITFLDQPLSTNSVGMRDRERSIDKPVGTFRVAVLGPSHVMGYGVRDDETFTRVLEDLLNDAKPAGAAVEFEVLNFGVARFSLLDQLALLNEKAIAFQPDVVIVTDSPRARRGAIGSVLGHATTGVVIPVPSLETLVDTSGIRALANDGLSVPFQPLRRVAGALGIDTKMPWDEAHRRLNPIADDIVKSTLEAIASVTRANGAVPVFLALENVADPPATRVQALTDAESAGILVFDLFGMWAGTDQSALKVAPWDNHPNAEGNRVIAHRLLQLIEQHRLELEMHDDPGRGTANFDRGND